MQSVQARPELKKYGVNVRLRKYGKIIKGQGRNSYSKGFSEISLNNDNFLYKQEIKPIWPTERRRGFVLKIICFNNTEVLINVLQRNVWTVAQK